MFIKNLLRALSTVCHQKITHYERSSFQSLHWYWQFKTKKKNNTCILYTEERAEKLALATTNIKLQNPGLITFYDNQRGNVVGLFL